MLDFGSHYLEHWWASGKVNLTATTDLACTVQHRTLPCQSCCLQRLCADENMQTL